ncbi:MAG TPA: hypothetical protein VMF90_14735 [Rhizobiaceae bacterium]|nr:hypothetical protein [Rhizobiaceae bacterium]
MNEMARLDQIRGQLDAIAPATWSLACTVVGARTVMMVEAAQAIGEPATLFTFDPVASSDEMQFAADAPGTVRFLVGLVDRAIEKMRPARDDVQPETAPPNYAAEAAIKCGQPAFKTFLMECHGLERPATDERTAQKLRSLLGITSRRELNRDTQAAECWRTLRGEFEAWRRRG